jgi:outer membrane protein assembly factor BamB
MRVLAFVSLALAGCASSQAPSGLFEPGQSDSGIGIAKVEERLRSVAHPSPVAVAVGVTTDGLVGVEVPAGTPWRRPGVVSSLPEVTVSGVVVGTAAGKAFALDGKTGKELFTVAAEEQLLRGAADDGRFTVLSLGKEGSDATRLVAVERGGAVVLDLDTDFALGRPAVVGGVAFVPWRGQYVSAIDLEQGQEIGRALLRDLVTYALDLDGTLWFGERGFVRFDDKIRFAQSFQGTRFEWKPRELPGKPVWLGSGHEVSRIDRSALPKIRVYAAPNGKEPGTLAGGTYAASYFRVVYGFGQKDGKLLWTDALSADVLGGGAAASGFVFCDANGTVHAYDPAGRSLAPTPLGAKLVACRVGASGFSISGAKDRGPLASQIEKTVGAVDSTMAAAEGLLIDELGKLEDPAVTRILIGFAESSRLPPAQRDAATTLLAGRRSGADDMLAALARHYDFISDEQAPPVGPLADALAAMGEKRAAPLLARHLQDPATSLPDVARAAKALEVLASTAELPALKTFFALYRATADEPELFDAVLSVARALVRIGGAEGRAQVERAANDSMTVPQVVKGLTPILSGKG